MRVMGCAVVPTLHAQQAPQLPSEPHGTVKRLALCLPSEGVASAYRPVHLAQPRTHTDKRFSILVAPSVCLQG